jgi:phosphoglycerate kinase
MDAPSDGRPGGRPVPGLDALELEDRRVLVRVDVNSPIEDGHVAGSARLREAAHTIEELLDRGAGVVILAHQGRPGRDDFTSLAEHAQIMSEEIGRDIQFTEHVADPQPLKRVADIEPGEALLLENVRGVEGELENVEPAEHVERDWVDRLAGEVDAFVLDAFPAAHRSHASIVGFPLALPSAAGPLMKRELDALRRAGTSTGGDRVLVLGGVKPDDALDVLEHHLDDDLADEALTGGVIGELFLAADGSALGEATEAALEDLDALQHLDRCRNVLDTHRDAIRTPIDVAEDVDGRHNEVDADALPAEGVIKDIGPDTAKAYEARIAEADTVVFNGPMGVYEDEDFQLGTRRVVDALATAEAFTLLGGGHTVTAMERFGYEPDAFDHVSLAGGALMRYFSGGQLPALAALRESARRFAISAK